MPNPQPVHWKNVVLITLALLGEHAIVGACAYWTFLNSHVVLSKEEYSVLQAQAQLAITPPTRVAVSPEAKSEGAPKKRAGKAKTARNSHSPRHQDKK